MDFTQDFWIGLVIGVFAGFIICRLVKANYIRRDTGPH